MLQSKRKIFCIPLRFLFSNATFFQNDLTAFIAPFSASPYYRTFGAESFLKEDQIKLLDERLSTVVSTITSENSKEKLLKKVQ
jgi:hypothetical protein